MNKMQESLENILAYKQIEYKLPRDLKESLLKTLNLSEEEVNKRMSGKEKEMEFILILHYMGVCSKLTAFDEGVSKMENTPTPDLLIELTNGEKFFLEIKSTKNDKWSISGGNLNRRMEYAKENNYKLRFAIAIKNFWMMFDSEYIKQKGGKISIADYSHSVLDDVLGTCSYFMPPGIKARFVYRLNTNKGMDIFFNDSGELISYELYYKDKKILRAKGRNSLYKVYPVLLEALHERLASLNRSIRQDGEFTIVEEADDGKAGNFISEYEWLMSPILHTIDCNGDLSTISNVFSREKNNEHVPRFNLSYYRDKIGELEKLGIPILVLHAGNLYKFNDCFQKLEKE